MVGVRYDGQLQLLVSFVHLIDGAGHRHRVAIRRHHGEVRGALLRPHGELAAVVGDVVEGPVVPDEGDPLLGPGAGSHLLHQVRHLQAEEGSMSQSSLWAFIELAKYMFIFLFIVIDT